MLLDRIELFIIVAKEQNLAKTARGMHVSPSSISQRLKSLETDFGVKLYKKSKGGIELTMAGHMVLVTATQVLKELEALRRSLNPRSRPSEQTLTIGATANPSAQLVPVALAAFQKKHPRIKVRFLTSWRRTVEKWVRDGDIDIAIIQSPTEFCLANLSCDPIAGDRLVLFASPDSLIAKKKRLNMAQLANSPLIIREGTGTTQKFLGWLGSQGVNPNIALSCGTPDAVKAAVRKNVGIGVLFYNSIKDEVEGKEVKLLTVEGVPELIAESYIVYRNIKQLSAPASEFLALLRGMRTAGISS